MFQSTWWCLYTHNTSVSCILFSSTNFQFLSRSLFFYAFSLSKENALLMLTQACQCLFSQFFHVLQCYNHKHWEKSLQLSSVFWRSENKKKRKKKEKNFGHKERKEKNRSGKTVKKGRKKSIVNHLWCVVYIHRDRYIYWRNIS